MGNERTPVVLVADDDPSLLALVAQHARTLGYQVLEASDGDEALELARKHLPDLIVLDVMMPGKSGWDVCRRVREDVSLAHTGVVMLTAIGENLNAMTSPLYGADEYIDKPFEFSELDEKIRATLEKRASLREAAPSPSVDETKPEETESAPPSEPGVTVTKKPAKKAAKKAAKKTVKKTAKKAAKKAARTTKAAKKAAKKPTKKVAAKTTKTAKKAAPAKTAKKAAKKATKKATRTTTKVAKKPAKKTAKVTKKPAKAAAKKAATKVAKKPAKKAAAKTVKTAAKKPARTLKTAKRPAKKAAAKTTKKATRKGRR